MSQKNRLEKYFGIFVIKCFIVGYFKGSFECFVYGVDLKKRGLVVFCIVCVFEGICKEIFEFLLLVEVVVFMLLRVICLDI